MSIYVALTQIKISDESASRHTASQADLRRRPTAPAAEAALGRYGNTRHPALVHPISHPHQAARRWRGHYSAKAWRDPADGDQGPAEPGEGLAEPGEGQADGDQGPAHPGEGLADGED